MDKRIAGLLGAVAAVGALSSAQAAPAPSTTDVLQANSYADLLEPIPNAAKVLQALDEQAPAKSAEGNVQVAQFYHFYHHHHHHGYFRRGPVIVVRPHRWHHHHHHHFYHHHHHHFDRY
jgi:opacity protein-like surface antigen